MSTRILRRLTLLLLLAGVAAFPQGLPLIAVLPLLAPEGLSAEDADAGARLLDTDLVKSSAEKEAISDESSAVRLARILDVATDRTHNAENEDVDTLEAGATLASGLRQPEASCATPWFAFSLSFAVPGGSGAVAGAPRSIPATMAGPAPGPALGSEVHLGLIREVQVSKGTRAALRKIMSDVRNQKAKLEALEEQAFQRLCNRINTLIERQVGPRTAEEHYFRNYLNRGVPRTLEEMVTLINASPPGRKWKLQSPKQAAFHMQGPDGVYNVKFVSPDGHFEAVYDKEGILLTEANDPINMGTYNYADPARELFKHVLYDVSPFGDWGNSAATSNFELYEDGMENALRFREDPQAKAAYGALLGRLGGERFRVVLRKRK